MEASSNGVFILGEAFILIMFILVTFGYIGATISVIVRDATHGDGDTESLVQNIFSIILSGLGIPAIALFSMFMHKIFTGRFDQLDASNATLVKKIEEGNKKIDEGNSKIIVLLEELISISKKQDRGTREDDFFLSRMDKKDSQRTFCSKICSVNSAEEQRMVIDDALRSGMDQRWIFGMVWEMGKFPVHPKSG